MTEDPMRYTTTIDIAADPEAVWRVLIDVERWPDWTPTVRKATRLDDGPFGIGSRTRLRQPRLPAAVWEVTEIDAPRRFTWVSRSPGVRITADHLLEPHDGITKVVLGVAQEGPLAPLLRPLTGRITERYVRLEAESLRTRVESAP
jgi:uncharacterized protein YndB with AHSA1/START domain